MIVIKKEPGQRAVVVEIENDLKALQQAVGGYIEVVYPYKEPVGVICNEEGLLMGLPFNTFIRGYHLFGTILIVGLTEDDFCDVPERYLCKILNAL